MKRGVGGAARRVAPASGGSSPPVSIKTRSRKVLRRMLADRDRALSRLEYYKTFCPGHPLRTDWERLDTERRTIRNRLKYLRHAPTHKRELS